MKTIEEIYNERFRVLINPSGEEYRQNIVPTKQDIISAMELAVSIETIELTNQIAVERKKTENIASENFKLIECLAELKREIVLPAKHSWSAEYNKAIEDFKQLNPNAKFKTQ